MGVASCTPNPPFPWPLICASLSKLWTLEPALRGARPGWKVCETARMLKTGAF